LTSYEYEPILIRFFDIEEEMSKVFKMLQDKVNSDIKELVDVEYNNIELYSVKFYV
jgi:cell fate (sporulation/competence/biofilm development) regulator YlbF (YheA/YmcA/DUF963 family)